MYSGAAPGGERVHIWFVRTDLPAPSVARLRAVLDPDEQRRAGEILAPAGSRRYVVAHGAYRLILGRYLDLPPADIRWRRGPNGKPELADLDRTVQVNLSHSGDLAVIALTGDRPVGVDIERGPSVAAATGMSHRYYLPAEAEYVTAAPDPDEQVSRFVRLWTRKEACIKAAGGRLFEGLRLPVAGTATPAGIVVSDHGGALPGPYRVRDLPAPQGFRAAVALDGHGPYRIATGWWRLPNEGRR
jgi:4'-phosphopantetheinyl transferase